VANLVCLCSRVPFCLDPWKHYTTKNGKKIETVVWTPYFNVWTLFLQVKICISARVGKSFVKCLFSALAFWRSSSKKLYLWLYLTQFMHSNGKILFPCWKIVYQSFYNAPLLFSSSSSKKTSMFSHVSASRLRSVYCLKILVKNDISSFIWHKLFIWMVKCSSFNQRIVYQSFTGVLLKFGY